MPTINVRQFYERHVQPLRPSERLQLIELIVQNLLRTDEAVSTQKRSIMELHGLGAEIWQGIDAQDYVHNLREEWDHRP